MEAQGEARGLNYPAIATTDALQRPCVALGGMVNQ
jgi:hypothetical protein